MITDIFLLTLVSILILIFLYILLRQCFSSNPPKKKLNSIRYSYPTRSRQRDYIPSPSNPCIYYIQRKSTYREQLSDNDSQDESSDFTYATPSHLVSNIENQKGGFKYDIKNVENERKEQSPLLPQRGTVSWTHFFT